MLGLFSRALGSALGQSDGIGRGFSSSQRSADAAAAGGGAGGDGKHGGAPSMAVTTATTPAASGGPKPPLTQAQQAALASLVLSSFKHDPVSAAGVLNRSLDEAARQELLTALGAEKKKKEPKLDRAAVLAPDDDDDDGDDDEEEPAGAAPAGDDAAAVAEPSTRQLLWVAFTKGLPFVAFGFMDNFIMITAGEQIDLAFGAKLGLSSMAAAGLGNTVADVVGINISHSIEQKTKGSKFLASGLTAAQRRLPSTLRAKWLGCAVGMASGCLLGLVPLWFIDFDREHARQHAEEEVPATSSTKPA